MNCIIKFSQSYKQTKQNKKVGIFFCLAKIVKRSQLNFLIKTLLLSKYVMQTLDCSLKNKNIKNH